MSDEQINRVCETAIIIMAIVMIGLMQIDRRKK